MSGKPNPIADALDRVIAASPVGWTIEQKERAIRSAVDLADLSARQAAGEDVEAELTQAAAVAKNIAAAAAVSSGTAIHEAVVGTLSDILRRALIGGLLLCMALLAIPGRAQNPVVVRPDEYSNSPAGECPFVISDCWTYSQAQAELVLDQVPPGKYSRLSFRPHFPDPTAGARAAYWLVTSIEGSYDTASAAQASLTVSNRTLNNVLLRIANPQWMPEGQTSFPPGIGGLAPEPWIPILFDVPWFVPHQSNVVLRIDFYGTLSGAGAIWPWVDGVMVLSGGMTSAYWSPSTFWTIGAAPCGVETKTAPRFLSSSGVVYLVTSTGPSSTLTDTIITMLGASSTAYPIQVGNSTCWAQIGGDPRFGGGALVLAFPIWDPGYLQVPATLPAQSAWFGATFGLSAGAISEYSGTHVLLFPSADRAAGVMPACRWIRQGGPWGSDWIAPVVELR